MAKYRKKPIVIEAVQYHLQEYADNPLTFEETPDWLRDAISNDIITPIFKTEDYWYLNIKTLEGKMLVRPADWIIQGVKGGIYPCKPDIFEATYEPVLEDEEVLEIDEDGNVVAAFGGPIRES